MTKITIMQKTMLHIEWGQTRDRQHWMSECRPTRSSCDPKSHKRFRSAAYTVHTYYTRARTDRTWVRTRAFVVHSCIVITVVRNVYRRCLSLTRACCMRHHCSLHRYWAVSTKPNSIWLNLTDDARNEHTCSVARSEHWAVSVYNALHGLTRVN